MTDNIITPKQAGLTRQKALKALKQSRFDYALKDIESGSVSVEKILEDFRVYQVELEIQNEELKQSQSLVEHALKRFEALFNALPLAGFVIDSDCQIIDCNHIAKSLFKVSKSSAFFPKFIVASDHLKFSRFIDETLVHGSATVLGLVIKGSAHGQRIVDVFSSRLIDVETALNNGQSVKMALLLIDRTADVVAQNQLKLAASVFETSYEGIMITDKHLAIVDVNDSFTRITGYPKDEVIGQTPSLLQSGKHDRSFYTQMWQSIREHGSWQGEVWNRDRSGRIYPELLTISSVLNHQGEVEHYIGVFIDITHRKASEEEISKLAFYDSLTSLPNRRHFKDRLLQVILSSTQSAKYAGLLFIDLDDFKNVNDSLGHDIGDQLLIDFSQRVQTCVRQSDSVSRLGGDEFVVVLSDLSLVEETAMRVAERVATKIVKSMEKPFLLATNKIYCTCSIGVTLFHGHTYPVDELLKQADLAMYRSKKTGKNAISFYDPKLQSVVDASWLAHNELANAIAEQQITLHYQLQVDARGQPYGVEALARWMHPEKGLIYPCDFIPVAEETGLIIQLGAMVIHQACQLLQRWAQSPLTSRLVIAVNISVKQVEQNTFVDDLIETIRHYQVNPSRLSIEITENSLIHNVESVIKKIKALNDFGIVCSLDDFGTGYSSLKYLSILPIHYIKIDQSFVKDIRLNAGSNSIVSSIIAISKSLGMGVVAEGVETDYQFSYLASHGVRIFQGYYFSKPMPVDALEAMLFEQPNLKLPQRR